MAGEVLRWRSGTIRDFRSLYFEASLSSLPAIRGHEKTSQTAKGWLTAVDQFAIMFEDRFKPIQG